MDLYINITKNFNQLIDYVMAPKNPIIFLNFPSSIVGNYEIELMNFMLNIDDAIIEQFKDCSPIYDKLTGNDYAFKSIFVYGKAKIIFRQVKGADIEFSLDKDFHNGKKAYHTWKYKVQKGDLRFQCGGYSSFLPYFVLINILCNEKADVSLRFSTDDCMVIDSPDDSFALSQELKYDYCNQSGKLFHDDFVNRYFINNSECLIPKDIAIMEEE